jgi:hypothetical protein
MAENYGNPIMVTRAKGVQGFPSILNEMLWRGNFSYRPEYLVYARGLGPGMVDYFATMFIPMRLVEGVNHSHNFVAHGTSVGMGIQEVVYNAMTHLHNEIPELWISPFQHFPIRGPQAGVNVVDIAPVGAPLYERRMSELVRALDHNMGCLRWELTETRRRLNELQRAIYPYVHSRRVQEHVFYDNEDVTVQEEAPGSFKYPFVHGIAPPHQGIQARMSNGLRVRRLPRTLGNRETIYGGQTENLTHPEANTDKTRSPNAQLLDVFPPIFSRAPYGPN